MEKLWKSLQRMQKEKRVKLVKEIVVEIVGEKVVEIVVEKVVEIVADTRKLGVISEKVV